MDKVNDVLNKLYEKGRVLKFTIPGEEQPDTSIEILVQQQQQQAANLKD